MSEGFNAGVSPLQTASADVDIAVDGTGAIGGLFARADGAVLTVVTTGRTLADLRGIGYPVRDSILSALARSALPTIQGPLDLLSPRIAEYLNGRGIVRFAACRSQALNRVTGVLALLFDTEGPPLDLDRLALLRLMAAQASGSLAIAEMDDADRIYLATASHELRTPVTVLRGFAATLDQRWDQLLEAERREGVEIIHRRAEELDVVMDRLTSRTRGEPQSVSLDAHPFDAGAELRDITERLHGFSSHHIDLSVADGLPPVLGDRAMLGVVLAELAANSAKYSPDGGDIEFSAEVAGSYLAVRVADRGIGVDPSEVEKVFARFWRSDTGESSGDGTGFGLYMVRRLVESQGGWVSIRPRTGGGTVVKIQLPLAEPLIEIDLTTP